jgi:phage FluMu gp28-like protein
MLSTEWYRDNMPKYKAAFEDKSIVLPKDADVLDDHRLIRMEKGVAKVADTAHTKGRDGGQRHGDAAIAGALAWYAVINGKAAEPAFGGRDPEPEEMRLERKSFWSRFVRPERKAAVLA